MPALLHCLAVTSLAGAALVTSACSGSADTPELSTESAAAVEQMNAACERWNAVVEARDEFPVARFDPEDPVADDLPAVGDYFAAGHAARDEMIDAIAELSVPDEVGERHRALVAALERGQATAREQVAAARAGDVAGFTATLDEADAAQQEIDAAASALGATECTA